MYLYLNVAGSALICCEPYSAIVVSLFPDEFY